MNHLKQHISIALAVVFITVQLGFSIHYVWVTHAPVKTQNTPEKIAKPSLNIGHHCDHLHIKFNELFFLENNLAESFNNLSFVYQASYYLDSPKQEWKFSFYTRGPPKKPSARKV